MNLVPCLAKTTTVRTDLISGVCRPPQLCTGTALDPGGVRARRRRRALGHCFPARTTGRTGGSGTCLRGMHLSTKPAARPERKDLFRPDAIPSGYGPDVDSVDLRLLRYFVAVAEECNFTRAAQRLAMAQPPLSRAIKQLETTVGVPLLVRSHGQVRLTPAGATLLEDAKALDEQAQAAIRRSRRAAEPRAVLRISAKAVDGRLLRRLVDSYLSTDDELDIDVVVTACRRQLDELRCGHVDAGLVRIPFARRALVSRCILSEPRIALVPAQHPLADAKQVPLDWLADEPVTVWRDADAQTDEYWAAAELDHHPWQRGPEVDDFSQLLAVVSTQRAIAFVPRSLLESHPLGGDIAALNVIGVSESEAHIAWPQTRPHPGLTAFVAHVSNDRGAAGYGASPPVFVPAPPPGQAVIPPSIVRTAPLT